MSKVPHWFQPPETISTNPLSVFVRSSKSCRVFLSLETAAFVLRHQITVDSKLFFTVEEDSGDLCGLAWDKTLLSDDCGQLNTQCQASE